MYTSYIGRRAIDLYNEHLHDGEPLSTKEFFDQVFFPVVFDDEDYLMQAGNSKFGQLVRQRKKDKREAEEKGISWEEEKPRRRQRALSDFHSLSEDYGQPHNHVVVGGSARKMSATTSGQVTNIDHPVDADAIYCSWVGAAAAVGVSKGLTMLIDEDTTLLALLEGWSQYRTLLSQTSGLKDKQIETWNGWWLTHRLSEDFRSNAPLSQKPDIRGRKHLKLATQDWVNIMFTLAKNVEDETVTAYVFSIGQRNTTIGFRQLYLNEARYLVELYRQLFKERSGVGISQFAQLYKTEDGLKAACRQGAIGLRALRPKDLDDYSPGDDEGDWFTSDSNSSLDNTTYRTFLTWIIAMLNNEDLIDTTEQLAEALRDYAQSDTKGRVTKKRTAEQVLKANHRREFLESLSAVVEDDATHAALIDEIGDEVVKMPSNDFPLFATLLRLKYKVFSQQQSA
jgi:uncharacterized protein YnzC (UPF0291/DUF896 family)